MDKAFAVVIVVGFAFCIWMQWFAPCSWFNGATLGSIPGRCLEFKK